MLEESFFSCKVSVSPFCSHFSGLRVAVFFLLPGFVVSQSIFQTGSPV